MIQFTQGMLGVAYQIEQFMTEHIPLLTCVLSFDMLQISGGMIGFVYQTKNDTTKKQCHERVSQPEHKKKEKRER